MARNRKTKRMRAADKRESGKNYGRKAERRKWGIKISSDGNEVKVKL